jgi:hypothetical protein
VPPAAVTIAPPLALGASCGIGVPPLGAQATTPRTRLAQRENPRVL